jgi:hypothetical protein
VFFSGNRPNCDFQESHYFKNNADLLLCSQTFFLPFQMF